MIYPNCICYTPHYSICHLNIIGYFNIILTFILFLIHILKHL